MRKILPFLVVQFVLTCTLQSVVAAPTARTFEEQIDGWVAEGFERPGQAVARLEQMHGDFDSLDRHRILLQAVGSIHARTGASALAETVVEKMLSLAPQDATGRMAAGANLVRALIADNADRYETAAQLAQAALVAFKASCAKPMTVANPACEYRSLWAANAFLERRANAAGTRIAATAYAQAAFDIAAAANDTRRQAINLSALGLYAQERNEPDAANELLAKARRLIQTRGDPAELARLDNAQAQLKALQGDWPAGLHTIEQALALAARANSPRLEAALLGTLAEINLQMGRAAKALGAAKPALVIARKFEDIHAERLLMAEISLAGLMTAGGAEDKAAMGSVLALWQQADQNGSVVRMLRISSEALAKAGDAEGALELYHRERSLSEEMLRADRDQALKELQLRNDAGARERQITRMSQEKALTLEALANRDLQQRVWQVLAAVMALVVTLAVMLYRQVRETNRRLGANRTELRTQSERDPLTHLVNRRYFHSVMASRDVSRGFEGTLMMIDVDHFKKVNDVYGHAAGDKVLVEVAKRLSESIRGDDLAVRWGGEEFLILASHASEQQAQLLAARLLSSLGKTPIDIDHTTLRVTASIGYARFPLPRCEDRVPWDQAIRLIDAALYVAKNEGRNRAVGITSSLAPSAEDLRNIEADLKEAWAAGRVTLVQTHGPETQDEAGMADNQRAA